MNDRLKKALHYVIHYAQSAGLALGGVKLLKIIVFSDVSSFYHWSKTITGAKIVKAPNGPVPDGHKEALEALEAEGKIRVIKRSRKYETTRFESLTPPDMAGFSVDEMHIMNDFARDLCGQFTAGVISNLSHNHSWEIAEMGEEIPLASYLGRRVEPTPEDIAETLAELSAAGLETETSLDA